MKGDKAHETDQDAHRYGVHAHFHIYIGDEAEGGSQEDAERQLYQLAGKLRLVAQHIPHPEIKDATGYIGYDPFAPAAEIDGVNKTQPFDQQNGYQGKKTVDHKKANQGDPLFFWRKSEEIRWNH